MGKGQVILIQQLKWPADDRRGWCNEQCIESGQMSSEQFNEQQWLPPPC